MRFAAGAQAFDFIGERDRGAHVFEIDDFCVLLDCPDQGFEMAFFDERARRQNDVDLGGLAGGDNVCRARREVQHGGNAADALQREERDGDAGGVRQQHADGGAFGREWGDLYAKDLRANDELFVRQPAAKRVFDGRAAGVARVLRQHEGFEQGLVEWRRQNGAIGHDVLQRETGCLAAGFAFERRIDLERDGRQDRHGRLWEPYFLGLCR